jgi:hypothetical protein
VGFSCTISEEPTSAWAEALAVIIFGAFQFYSAEEEGGILADPKTASKTLAILLFLGVPVALGSFDNIASFIFGGSSTLSVIDSDSPARPAIILVAQQE